MVTIRQASTLLLWSLLGLVLPSPMMAFDEVADMVLVGLDESRSTSTSCRTIDPKARPRTHMPFVRAGTQAVMGDAPSTYDEPSKCTRSIEGQAKEDVTLCVGEDGGLVLTVKEEDDEGECSYHVRVLEGSVMGVQNDEGKYKDAYLFEAGTIKVGLLDESRSTLPASQCLDMSKGEPVYWEGQTLAFVRWQPKGATSEETEVVLRNGETKTTVDATHVKVGRPACYIWKEGEGTITLSMNTTPATCSTGGGKEEEGDCQVEGPSGCVFSATVLEGKVFGVKASK